MASKIKVDQIEGQSGTTVTLPSGQTLDLSSGSVTLPNTSVSNAQLAGSIDLTTKVTGALPTGNLPTIPVSKGGTGLTSLGSAGQAIKVNSGGNALEFGSVSATNQMERIYHADVSGSPSRIDIQIGDCSNYESIYIYTSNLCQSDSGEDVYWGILITSSYTYKTGSNNYYWAANTGGGELSSASDYGMRIQGGGNHASDARFNSVFQMNGMKSGEYTSGWGHASYQNSSSQRHGCQGFGMCNFTDTVYGFTLRTQSPSTWRNQGSITVMGVRKT